MYPYYKGFDTLSEAFSIARQQLEENYYVSSKFRIGVNTAWDNKIIFVKVKKIILRRMNDELDIANSYIKELHQKNSWSRKTRKTEITHCSNGFL
jgi:hypothetical protein